MLQQSPGSHRCKFLISCLSRRWQILRCLLSQCGVPVQVSQIACEVTKAITDVTVHTFADICTVAYSGRCACLKKPKTMQATVLQKGL